MARTEVCLAASVGGHLELLEAVRAALNPIDSYWVTTDGARPRALAEKGERVFFVEPLDRRNMSVRSLISGVRLAMKLRPKVVITSGAGVVGAFCLVSRLLGAKLLFIETMARVNHASATGRFLGPFADSVIVQWDELRVAHRRAIVCAPLLLAGLHRAVAGGVGTFVSVGSHPAPFQRMVGAVGDAVQRGVLPTPVLAQLGAATLSLPEVNSVAKIDPEAFGDAIEGHLLTVCHGGAGVIAAALRSGKRPIVMARLQSHGEHVDDHQTELIDKLDGLGLIVRVDRTITEADVADALESRPSSVASFAGLPSVPDVVRAWLEKAAE